MKFEIDLPDADIDQLREVIDALPLNRYIGLVARLLPQMPLTDPWVHPPVAESLEEVLRLSIVTHDPKPIPDRRYDWQAAAPHADERGPFGFGDSAEAALADLKVELES